MPEYHYEPDPVRRKKLRLYSRCADCLDWAKSTFWKHSATYREPARSVDIKQILKEGIRRS